MKMFVSASRHWEALTTVPNLFMCPLDTRSAWTQLYASHTLAVATGSQSPSDRYTHTHTHTVQMVVIFWLWPSACWEIWWTSIKKMHLLLLLAGNKRSTETGWVFGVGEPVPSVLLPDLHSSPPLGGAVYLLLPADILSTVCDASIKVWGWARRGRKRGNSK